MNTDLMTMNIPNLTVTGVVGQLTRLYSRAIRCGKPFKKLPTAFLWGPAGVGKSNGVFQLAEQLEAQTGKRVVVTDVRLLLFSPIDLRGVPVADVQREFTDWLKPRIFDMSPDADVVNLLFLDELSAAPQSVQAAAYQICQDRRVGEHVFPDNCLVIAAGNRTTDQSVSYKMPKALCNRLMHFNIKSDYESWRAWAVKNEIAPSVIAFLGMDNSRLCVEPENSDMAYPTPRSWEFVSTVLQTMGEEPEEVHHLIAGCIGNDMAVEFEAYCKGALRMPDVRAILEGRCKEIARGHDVIFALMAALVAAVRNAGDDQLNNACQYVQQFPKDFVMAFMRDLQQIPGMDARLMKCHSFQQWLNKNG